MIKIKTLSNGWLVTDEDKQEIAITYEDDFDNLKHDRALVDLLYTIKESLGEYWSKHNKYNVEIRVIDQNGRAVKEEK